MSTNVKSVQNFILIMIILLLLLYTANNQVKHLLQRIIVLLTATDRGTCGNWFHQETFGDQSLMGQTGFAKKKS